MVSMPRGGMDNSVSEARFFQEDFHLVKQVTLQNRVRNLSIFFPSENQKMAEMGDVRHSRWIWSCSFKRRQESHVLCVDSIKIVFTILKAKSDVWRFCVGNLYFWNESDAPRPLLLASFRQQLNWMLQQHEILSKMLRCWTNMLLFSTTMYLIFTSSGCSYRANDEARAYYGTMRTIKHCGNVDNKVKYQWRTKPHQRLEKAAYQMCRLLWRRRLRGTDPPGLFGLRGRADAATPTCSCGGRDPHRRGCRRCVTRTWSSQ